MTGIASRKHCGSFQQIAKSIWSVAQNILEENNVDYMSGINGRTAGTRRTLGSLTKALGLDFK